MERTKDELRIVATAIPIMAACADRFAEHAETSIAYADFVRIIEGAVLTAEAFAGEAFKAISPATHQASVGFESSNNTGVVAIARWLALDMLVKNPDVILTAYRNAERSLWQALQDGTLPDTF